jgi:hypothetical protein
VERPPPGGRSGTGIVLTLRLLPVAAMLALGFVLATCGGGEVRPNSAVPSPTNPDPSRLTLPSARSQYVAAQLANATFSVRYDQADYHAVYLMLDQSYRSEISESQLTSMLGEMRERLGKSGGMRERSHETAPLGESGDVVVTFVMDSTFEKGTATQTFIWRVTPSNVTYLLRYQSE